MDTHNFKINVISINSKLIEILSTIDELDVDINKKLELKVATFKMLSLTCDLTEIIDS